MNFTSQSHNRKNSILKDGTHLVTISEVSDDLAKGFPSLWSDRTPQLRFKFKSASGAFISQWVNLLGYYTKESIGEIIPAHITFKQHPVSKEFFAVDVRNNKRIENKEKTAVCHAIIGRIASSSGMIDGQDFGLNDLLGRQLYITVANGKVTHTHTIQEMVSK
jgi:hypothetical protein